MRINKTDNLYLRDTSSKELLQSAFNQLLYPTYPEKDLREYLPSNYQATPSVGLSSFAYIELNELICAMLNWGLQRFSFKIHVDE